MGGRVRASLALVGLIALVGCCHAFDTDTLYRYDFEGAVTTRVASAGSEQAERPQYSGMALRSPIQVKKSGADELTLRLEKPQIATFNEIIPEIHTHQFAYKPLEPATSGGLDKAFRIYFDAESGSVKSFDSHKDEPKWVTNFKRGLLSFFQLKLKADDSTYAGQGGADSAAYGGGGGGSTSSSSSSSAAGAGGSSRPTGNHQYYTTSERSVFGECETDYLVMAEPLASGGGGGGEELFAMNVTKTRNMARCKSRFVHRFMPIDARQVSESDNYKHSSAIFQFDLIGTRANYVIQQVLLDETYTYSPFGPAALRHVISSKFMMKLARAEKGSGGPDIEDSSLARLESLSYDPPETLNFYANINLDQEHHLSSIYQTSASVDQVMQAFEALVQEHRAYSGTFDQAGASGASPLERSRLAELFMRLNELVGTLNLAKIEQLYAQVDERGEAHKKIFWDLMSVTGTNPSFVFMKRLITDGDAPSVKIKDFLTRLSYHIKMPSKGLFDEYVNLCKSDKIQTNQQYKRLCSLPLASLIHQHCAKPHATYLRLQQEGANATAHKRGQNTCQIATAEEYFARLVSPFAGASAASGASSSSGSPSPSSSDSEMSTGDKMFQVKMAGELGVKPSVDFLMDVVANRDEHPSLRAAAMWNLNKVARIYPNQIKRMVVPYYQDSGELLELRLAAFHDWLVAGMSLHELETLAKQLQREPSRQVVIYVHSLLDSLATAGSMPGDATSSSNAALVLPALRQALTRHSPASVSDSRASMSRTEVSQFGYATVSLASTIFSNESRAPSNFFYSSSELMSGFVLTPMSVSVQAHGLDKMIKRVAGISGLLADKESFMDVFSLKRRNRRQAVTAELIKQEAQEIDKELKLAPREFSDVYLAVTVSAYGRPVTFFDRDSRELKKMLKDDGTIQIPQIKRLLHTFNNHTTQQMMISFEKLEVFNNELGLPLYQSFSDFEFKTFKLNSIKLDVEPGFFRDERQGKPPTRLAAALDAKMGRHNEMFISSGALVSSERQQVGVGFYKKKLVNVPIKMAIEANLTANLIQIKRAPIHSNLLYIKQTPITFVRSYDPAKPVRGEADQEGAWKPLYDFNRTNQMSAFKLDYMTPLAVGLQFEGKHRAGEDWSRAAWMRYLNKAGLGAAKFMYFYSPTGAPLEARLSTVTTGADENPTRDLVTQFTWRHHHHHYDSQQAELSDVERALESVTATAKSLLEGRPTTVSYKLALLGGSARERRVSLDLAYSHSHDRLVHKWRAFYQRTPLDQADPKSEVTNLCWLGQMDFPDQPAKALLDFQLGELDHSANLTSELTFGDDCATGAKAAPSAAGPHVSAKLTAGWSQEQRAAIEAALSESSSSAFSSSSASEERAKNAYAQLWAKCKAKRQAHGSKLDPVCVQLMRKTGELTHVRAQFDYKDVPQRWTSLVRRLGSLYTYARAGYIEEMDERSKRDETREYRSSDGLNDLAHLEANISASSAPGERLLSYEFDTSSYHVMYRNVPISVPPVSTFSLMGSASLYQSVRLGAGSASCLVSNQSVTTFDSLTYTMPPVGDGCFKLLAKDCSPEANYVVLGAKVNQAKVVKVYLAQKFKVEFVPDKDGKQRVSDIKVNGETVQIEQGKPALRRDTKLGARAVEAFTIDYNGAYYTLNSKLYKFSVSTDGTWIHIQQSKYYAGKSCGLCGDANGDHLLEFKSPVSAKRVCRNTSDFVWSYVLPSTCASRPANIECAA